jgi:hypothetical protein
MLFQVSSCYLSNRLYPSKLIFQINKAKLKNIGKILEYDF